MIIMIIISLLPTVLFVVTSAKSLLDLNATTADNLACTPACKTNQECQNFTPACSLPQTDCVNCEIDCSPIRICVDVEPALNPAPNASSPCSPLCHVGQECQTFFPTCSRPPPDCVDCVYSCDPVSLCIDIYSDSQDSAK